MKQQITTPRTQVLSLVSYTRKLAFSSSKFSRTLFLILFSVLFSQISFAQTTISSASVNDDMPVPGYYFSAKHIETCVAPCSNCTTAVNVAPHLVAFVTDGDGTVYASFTPERKAGLTVTDDMGNFAFFAFDAATYSGGSPTVFKNPDVVLLEDSRTAIVTFETDDATNNSYILELDIVATSSSINISQTSGLNGPIKNNSFASSPRIDGDYEKDRFAIVTIQNNTAIYSIYEPDGMGSYLPMVNINDLPAGNPANNTAMLPDISLGHLVGGAQDPECVVSYVDGDPGGSTAAFLIVNYQDITPSFSNQLNYQLPSNTLFTSYDLYPNYPHICSEEEFTTTGTMQWALAESLVDPSIATNSGLFPNHMLYVHSDYYYQSNGSALFYLDASNTTTNTYQQGMGTLDWMSTDGFVAWRHEIASPNTQQVVGILAPFSVGFSNWDQVYYNYNVATVTGTDWLQALSIGSESYNINLYVVAELYIGKIIYKVRQIGTTGFKPNNISITNKYIYPNPCNDILIILADSPEQATIKDIYGSTILNSTLHTGINTVNTSQLGIGNYFLLRKGNSPNSLFTVSH